MPTKRQTCLLAFVLLAACAGRAVAAARQAVPHPVPAAVASAQPVGRLAADRQLLFAISLPLRNQPALTNLLEEVYNPASPRCRQFLTPEQFTALFGPSEADYQAVVEYAKASGFTVVRTHPNRTLLALRAPVAEIERAFGVTMRTYAHPTENRTFLAPDAAPSLDLAVPVLGICGLNDFSIPRPLSHLFPAAGKLAGEAAPLATGSGPGGAYLGWDFRAAYYKTNGPLTGAGQSVGLLQFDGYDPADITAYKQLAGLPDVPVTNVLLNGATGSSGANNFEVCLDIEMAIAMAPGLDKVIVYETNPNNAIPNDVLNQMTTDNAAKQLSSSWIWSPRDATADQIYQQMALQGQSFFQASGDSDAYTDTVSNPADVPYLTVVGGTTLLTYGAGGAWYSENTWNRKPINGTDVGTGGGISTIYVIPSWQQGIDMTTNQGSPAMRNLPDVALVAESVHVKYNSGGSNTFGGTSCAAPLWAGFMALVNQQAASNGLPPVGFLNPALYAVGKGTNYTAAFHDITTGNNYSTASPAKFAAVPGYDLCTGWGTPRGSNTINALASYGALRIASSATPAFLGPPGGPFLPGAASISMSNAGLVSLTWSAGTTASWFRLALSNGVLAAGAKTNITVTLTAGATGLVAGTHTDLAWITNTVDGSVHASSVALLAYVVQNGGFETGNLTNWTTVGTEQVMNKDYIYRWSPEDTNTFSGSLFVRDGTYGLLMGTYGSLGSISQTLRTTSGCPYLLSLWMSNPWPDPTNEFRVQWGGSTLYDQVNLPAITWTNLQFVVMANASSTVLQIAARNDPYAFGLDEVSARQLALPAFGSIQAHTNTSMLAWRASTNVHYQPQYASNLVSAQWVNLGAPILGTADTMTATDSSAAASQRFYRVILQP